MIKLLSFSLIFSIIISILIESYNWLRGFDDFSIQRELIILLTNFIIGFLVGLFYYRNNLNWGFQSMYIQIPSLRDFTALLKNSSPETNWIRAKFIQSFFDFCFKKSDSSDNLKDNRRRFLGMKWVVHFPRPTWSGKSNRINSDSFLNGSACVELSVLAHSWIMKRNSKISTVPLPFSPFPSDYKSVIIIREHVPLQW